MCATKFPALGRPGIPVDSGLGESMRSGVNLTQVPGDNHSDRMAGPLSGTRGGRNEEPRSRCRPPFGILEVETVSRTISTFAKSPYGVARLPAVLGSARSSYYDARQRRVCPEPFRNGGPNCLSDEERVNEIRLVLDESLFHGEGYRKIQVRPRHKNIRVWKDRRLPGHPEGKTALHPSARQGPTKSAAAARLRGRIHRMIFKCAAIAAFLCLAFAQQND